MAARIEGGDAAKIAKNLGAAGRPMPDWVSADPALVSAYDQGTGAGANGAAFHPPVSPRAAAPTAVPAAAPAKKAKGKPSSSTSTSGERYVDRAFSPSAAVGRTPFSALSSAGDGGGLMLAFVLYPIALATLRNGAAGPGLWFRAKWLNETVKEPNNLGPVAAHNATNPGANDPAHPGYHNPGLPTPGIPDLPNQPTPALAQFPHGGGATG